MRPMGGELGEVVTGSYILIQVDVGTGRFHPAIYRLAPMPGGPAAQPVAS